MVTKEYALHLNTRNMGLYILCTIVLSYEIPNLRSSFPIKEQSEKHFPNIFVKHFTQLIDFQGFNYTPTYNSSIEGFSSPRLKFH